jgi:hypothetical protein
MSPELTHLHTRLSAALKVVPGARQLVAFGSNRNGVPDAFSDLDLQLLVDDCPTALPVVLSFVGEVISPEIEWTFSDDANHYWLMAIPDASRPWAKVDLGLDPYNDGRPENFGWTGEAEWTQPAPTDPTPVTVAPDWPRPALGTVENFVLWQLIDLGMLTKCHHRGQPLNVLDHVAQLGQAVVTVEAFRQDMGVDFSDGPFGDFDIPSTTIRELEQSAFANLGDMNVPLVDHIRRLATTLCDGSGADKRTRMVFERMIDGCDAVLRGARP